MKITYSKENINSFGGVNLADRIINNIGVYDVVDQTLGNRSSRASFSYSGLIRSYLLMVLCGGECAEDITVHLRKELGHVKGFEVCSADTLLRMQKELATEKETFLSKSNIEHDFNINMDMNQLMVSLLVKTKQLLPGNKDYIFDYDNQFIPTGKYDSKRSYKNLTVISPASHPSATSPFILKTATGTAM
jgi:hypothetical protein